MALEATLQDKILRDLDSLGKYCVAFKIRKSSVDGTPDVFFTTLKTGPALVEIKRPDGTLSPKQEEMLKDLNDCGCRAFAVWSWKDWVELKCYLMIKPDNKTMEDI